MAGHNVITDEITPYQWYSDILVEAVSKGFTDLEDFKNLLAFAKTEDDTWTLTVENMIFSIKDRIT